MTPTEFWLCYYSRPFSEILADAQRKKRLSLAAREEGPGQAPVYTFEVFAEDGNLRHVIRVNGKYAFAVDLIETYYGGGNIARRTEFASFREVAEGVSIPSEWELEWYGVSAQDGRSARFPLQRTWILSEVKLNARPDESLFRLTFPEGTSVADWTAMEREARAREERERQKREAGN